MAQQYFIDTFPDSALNTAKWDSAGSVSVGSGVCTLTGANGSCYIKTKNTWNKGVVFTCTSNCPRTVLSGHFVGFNKTDGSKSLAFLNAWDTSSNIFLYAVFDDGTSVKADTGVAAGSTQRVFKIIRLDSGYALCYIDGNLVYTTQKVNTQDMLVQFGNIYDSGMVMTVDQVKVELIPRSSPVLYNFV